MERFLLFSFPRAGSQVYFIRELKEIKGVFRLPTANDFVEGSLEKILSNLSSFEKIKINSEEAILAFYSQIGNLFPGKVVVPIIDFAIPMLEGALENEDVNFLKKFTRELLDDEKSRELFPVFTKLFNYPKNVLAIKWFIKFRDEVEKGEFV